MNRYGMHLFMTNKIMDFNKVGTSDYVQGVSTQLHNIPKIINLDEKQYKLRGAIEMKTSMNIFIYT